MKEVIVKSCFLLVMAISVFSCTPTSKYPRKKLPDMWEGDGMAPDQMYHIDPLTRGTVPLDNMSDMLAAINWTNNMNKSSRKKLSEPTNELRDLCPSVYNIHNNRQDAGETSTISIGETMVAGKSYYKIQIDNTANDEAILGFIKSYSAFAGCAVDMLLSSGKEGALINIGSEEGSSTARAEFLVKKTGSLAFSVIFTWDQLSAARATIIMNELQQLPGITFTCIDNNKHF